MPIPASLTREQATRAPHDRLTHPGWDADIERLFDVFLAAEGGVVRPMADALDDRVRSDGKYRGCVAARTAAITGPLALVIPASDDPDDKAAAAMLREDLEPLDDVMHAFLAYQQRAPLMYGFGLTEMSWRWSEAAQRYVVAELHNVQPRNTQVWTTSNRATRDGRPGEILVQTGSYEYQVERQIPGKYIETRNEKDVFPTWGGIGLTSTIWSVMKAHTAGDYMLKVHRFGLPFPIVKIADWANEGDKAIGREIIASLGTDGGMLVPKNSRIELELHDAISNTRNATSDLHQRHIDLCNAEIAVLWLGSVLSTEAGQQGASYALAAEQGNVSFRLLVEDARRVERAIRAQWFKPWMQYNGIRGRTPRLKIFLARIENPEVAVRMAKTLHEIGYNVSADQLLEMTGLRFADDPTDSQEPENTELE